MTRIMWEAQALMERDAVGDADGWRRVFSFVEARKKGRTWNSIYPVTASQGTFRAMRDHGTPLANDTTRFKVCDGLGWSQDSIDRILKGGEPVVVGEIKRSTGKLSNQQMADEMAEMRHEVRELRRVVAELLGEVLPSPLED